MEIVVPMALIACALGGTVTYTLGQTAKSINDTNHRYPKAAKGGLAAGVGIVSSGAGLYAYHGPLAYGKIVGINVGRTAAMLSSGSAVICSVAGGLIGYFY